MMIKDCKLSYTITSYPYGTVVGKVCKTELLEYLNKKWWILMM